jgi:hypothetical protein
MLRRLFRRDRRQAGKLDVEEIVQKGKRQARR